MYLEIYQLNSQGFKVAAIARKQDISRNTVYKYLDMTHEDCLRREMLEETGYEVFIGSFIGNAMRYHQSIDDEPLLGDGYFYLARLLNKVQEPIEDDHYLRWLSIKQIEKLLFNEHQVWAVNEGLTK
ncbi:helix-turn-helix domain-containing protein [Tepidibacillus marianensis]|uniref:helix-turn-helix domain-containing protein n=1 Tax=Tepidibacillus marianensis TaxID=3131995 RepID=UPI0030CD7E43